MTCHKTDCASTSICICLLVYLILSTDLGAVIGEVDVAAIELYSAKFIANHTHQQGRPRHSPRRKMRHRNPRGGGKIESWGQRVYLVS